MHEIKTYNDLYEEFKDGRLFILEWQRTDAFDGPQIYQFISKDKKVYKPQDDEIVILTTRWDQSIDSDCILIDYILKYQSCSCDEYRLLLGLPPICSK